MWQSYNANPRNKRVGDCTVRAISKILDQSWEETYLGLCIQGFAMADMPSANNVWGSYLRRKGFDRNSVSKTCPECYTVRDFCEDHPTGEYVVSLNSHVVAVVEGILYDTWDSSDEIVLYFWEKRTES